MRIKWTVVPRRVSPDRFCTKAIAYVRPSNVEIPHWMSQEKDLVAIARRRQNACSTSILATEVQITLTRQFRVEQAVIRG
jgi:hypothetical protein